MIWPLTVLAVLLSCGVVPAVDQEAGQRHLVVDRVGGAQPGVVVRDGPREQQAARVVPVVLGLDQLLAAVGDELAEIELQPFADRGQEADVGLLDVLVGGRATRFGGVHQRGGRAVIEIDPEAGAAVLGRLLLERDFGEIEAQRVVRDVEVVETVRDRHAADRGARLRRAIEVVGVIGVDEAGDLDLAEEIQGRGILLGRGVLRGRGVAGRRRRGRGRHRQGRLDRAATPAAAPGATSCA